MTDDTSRRGFRPASSTNGNGSGDQHPLLDDADTAQFAEVLIESFPPVEPSPDVWTRIEAQISETPATRSERSATGGWSPSRFAPLMAIAAVFVLVAASAFALAQSSTEADPIAAAPDVVRSLTDPVSGDVTVRVVSQTDGTSLAINDGLPALPDGQTYQLWSVVGDEVVSVGLLGSNPADVSLRLEGSPSVLALTVEVAGGVAVSQADPVAVWTSA